MHESHGPLKREKKDTMSHKPRSVGPQTNMNRVNNCRTFGQVTSASGQGSTRVSALPAQAQGDSMHEETPFPGLHFCRIGPGDFPGSRNDPFTPTHGGLASGIFSSEYKRLCCFISIRCGILHRDESLNLFPCFVPERERERVSFSF